MRRIGLRGIYQKPRTTVPSEPSERFPCLVDIKHVRAADQIWASDQRYQFTSSDFVARLQAKKIKISWTGRNRCYDNILVERYGAQSSTRGCICMHTAMAGKLRSA